MGTGRPVSGSADNGKGAREVGDESTRLRGERRPLNRMGPEHGCGMKQARELGGGGNRREAENA